VIDYVGDFVERADLREVSLLGHSWGGYVITGAAPRLASRLRRLVYWSAFVPAAGRCLNDEVPPHYTEMFVALAEASGDNSVTMPFDVWQNAFMQDAPEPVQRTVHELLVPHPMQYFTTPVEPIDPAALGVPASYVLSVDDISLPPGEYGWDRFARRLGVEPIAAPGSHEACFTQPDGLVASILKA
jgi:pimeloyl-ACP methyl ester carboxylesterase